MNIKASMILQTSICAFASVLLGSGRAMAANRYVANTGADGANTCLSSVSPCLTLQQAVNQSTDGDIIVIAAGAYVSSTLNINKSVTLQGVQAGVDARSRSGAESIINVDPGVSVSANNVTFDGLTVQGNTQSVHGFGIWLNPGVDGTRILNTIIQNNIVGIGLANAGTTECLIQHNLIQNNNNTSLGANGFGIFNDRTTGGVASNVTINENLFRNQTRGAVAFANLHLATPTTNIRFTNNAVENSGRGIILFNSQNVTVSGNSITDLTLPPDGNGSVGVAALGAVNNLTITGNTLQNGMQYGIRINDIIGSNSNIVIHQNSITGFANTQGLLSAGLRVTPAPVSGPTDYATCNWWGSRTGPKNPILNPQGKGASVLGDVVVENFKPWLLGPAPGAVCGIAPTIPLVSQQFAPANIRPGEQSVLTITLTNPSAFDANILVPLVDSLPSGLTIAALATTTCGGTLSSTVGGTTLTLTGGVIPANSSCSIVVSVTTANRGSFKSIFPAGALQTDNGNNAEAGSAELNVEGLEEVRNYECQLRGVAKLKPLSCQVTGSLCSDENLNTCENVFLKVECNSGLRFWDSHPKIFSRAEGVFVHGTAGGYLSFLEMRSGENRSLFTLKDGSNLIGTLIGSCRFK